MGWCYQQGRQCPGRETTGCCGHPSWVNSQKGVRFFCSQCGAEHNGQHFCPALGNVGYGAREQRQLTEEDVRRIVREEVARAMAVHLLRPHADPVNPIPSQGTTP